jgi:hypothetical protein
LRRGVRRLQREAMREMVVDSPPGMMSAEQASNSAAVRTGRNLKVYA